MWPFGEQLSLARRIVVSVAIGLGLILLLFGLVALWTIRDITAAAYRQRVVLAQAVARHSDDVLRYASGTLEREAKKLQISDGSLTDEQRQHLIRFGEEIGAFGCLAVTDIHGMIVWAAAPATDPQAGNLQASRCFDNSRRVEVQSVVQLRAAIRGDSEVACLTAPIFDQNGLIQGGLVAELDPASSLPSLLLAGESEDGMRVQLVNSTGRPLLNSIGTSVGGNDAEHAQMLAPLIQARTAGYALHTSQPWEEDTSHLVAYAPLQRVAGWGIVVEQPKDLVVTVPRRIQWRLALFGLAALFIAVAAAWQDVRRVVWPLKHLTSAAERFAAGQLDEPVQSDRSDELGILIRAFETMRQRLRASLAEVAEWNRELEHRVAARTVEVEERNRELARLYEALRAREHERAELLQQVIVGQEEERRRLAQELHDDASQALASLQLGLERLADGNRSQTETKHLADQLREIAAQTLAEVHRLAVELRPSVLDDVGLVAAIERYLQEYARQWDLPVDFTAVDVDDFRLLPAAETAVYRIIQAALTNVAKHAKAQHVSVLLKRRDDKLVVVVEDDGIGFELEAIRAASLEKRLGLAGMQERASLIGATITVETAPNAGTTIFIEVPISTNRRRDTGNEAVDEVGDVEATSGPR